MVFFVTCVEGGWGYPPVVTSLVIGGAVSHKGTSLVGLVYSQFLLVWSAFEDAGYTKLRGHHERHGRLFGKIRGRMGARADKTHEAQERECQEEDEGTNEFDFESEHEIANM